jgi:hypothetical protein
MGARDFAIESRQTNRDLSTRKHQVRSGFPAFVDIHNFFGITPSKQISDGPFGIGHMPVFVGQNRSNHCCNTVSFAPGSFACVEVKPERASDSLFEIVSVGQKVSDLVTACIGVIGRAHGEACFGSSANDFVEHIEARKVDDRLSERLDRAGVHFGVPLFVALVLLHLLGELGPRRMLVWEVIGDRLRMPFAGSVEIENPSVRRWVRDEIAMPKRFQRTFEKTHF